MALAVDQEQAAERPKRRRRPKVVPSARTFGKTSAAFGHPLGTSRQERPEAAVELRPRRGPSR